MKSRSFALVTGASQGLGRAITFELAKKKMNLVLVALPNSGLTQLRDFLEQYYAIEVHKIEADLSTKENCREILNYIDDNQIGVKYLINNAGILSRGFFEESSIEFVIDQIMVNVMAPTYLTHKLLDNLKLNSPGAILNVSSLASFFPLPVKQVYCGTKAYLSSFSQSLKWELEDDDISVSVLCPGGLNTTTKLCHQNRTLSWFNRLAILSPERAAKIAVDGMLNRKVVIVPGWVNRFYLILSKLLPDKIKNRLIAKEMHQIGLIYRKSGQSRKVVPQESSIANARYAAHRIWFNGHRYVLKLIP